MMPPGAYESVISIEPGDELRLEFHPDGETVSHVITGKVIAMSGGLSGIAIRLTDPDGRDPVIHVSAVSALASMNRATLYKIIRPNAKGSGNE